MEQETENTTNLTENELAPEVQVEVEYPGKAQIQMKKFDAKAVATQEGVFALETEKISFMTNLGMAVNDGGAIKVADGFTFWTQEKLMRSIGFLAEAIETQKLEDPIKAAYCLGYLSKIMFSGAATMKNRPNLLTMRGENQGRQTSFPAHGKVQFTQNNYYNKEEEDKKP